MYEDDTVAVPLAEGLQLLYLSSRPGYPYQEVTRSTCRRFVDQMKADEVRLAVVLLTFSEMEAWYGMNLCQYYQRSGIDALHYPVEDGSIPTSIVTFHRLVEAIHHRLATDRVLVHCSAGIGRTGMVAAGLLIRAGERSETAIARIRSVRPGAVENRWQEDFLQHYCAAVSRSA